MLKAKNGRVYYGCVDITDEPILNWTSADGKVFLKPSMMEKKKDFVVCVDEENALWEIYVNWDLVGIERCGSKNEAEKVLREYQQRQYDMEEACMDMEWEYEF